MQGHENFISQLDWSRDGRFLQSVSGDYDLLYCKSMPLTGPRRSSVTVGYDGRLF